MHDADCYPLLHGPYRPPCLHPGDRATCLFRDCSVIVTSWSDTRIPWPRCRAEGTHGGGSGILLQEELARAVRCEAAATIMYFWGVTGGTVWRWRKALRVTIASNEGSRRLLQAAAEAGGQAMHRRGLTAEERRACGQRAVDLNLTRNLRPGGERPWTTAELQLLGTEPDDAVAGKIGRTAGAVRIKRTRLGIPTTLDRRRKTSCRRPR